MFTRSTHDYIGEISVSADTVTFRSWTKTLETRLSDIVRLGARHDFRGLLPLALQYRTADGGSDEVWLGHGWSRHQSQQLYDAIAARLAARK